MTQQDGNKIINTTVAFGAIVLGYVSLAFVRQLNEWFELEAVVPNFLFVSQAVAIAIGLIFFIVIKKNPKTSHFLDEVYSEMGKVLWPNAQETNRHTVGIIIAVTIAGFLFGIFDFSASKLLSFIGG